jgi:hypothetical protein
MIASSAMGIKGESVSDIISKFIGMVKATNTVGTGMAMINTFTEDPVLAKLLKDAAGIHLAEDGTVSTNKNLPKHYTGNITPNENTIFVFGSNPEGRHGAGAAKVAAQQFGAVYGQGEGLQGNSYAIPTKDLRVKDNNSYRSISEKDIVESIRKMYEVAEQNPDKQFKVAYRNGLDEKTLNGYTGRELISMFKQAGPIPSNVYFSQEWISNWDSVDVVAQSRQEAEETGARTYEPSTDAQNDNLILDISTAEFYSGGATGSDTEWATIAKQLGIKVKEYTPADYDALPQEWKEKLDKEYRSVAIDEGRKILPEDTYSGKLVRRDMMQADKADAIFAIVNTDSSDGSIQGGTAYAVRRGWQRRIPVYYFDQADGKWYETIYESDGEIACVSMNSIPKLTQHAAVVGTRKITDVGK